MRDRLSKNPPQHQSWIIRSELVFLMTIGICVSLRVVPLLDIDSLQPL